MNGHGLTLTTTSCSSNSNWTGMSAASKYRTGRPSAGLVCHTPPTSASTAVTDHRQEPAVVLRQRDTVGGFERRQLGFGQRRAKPVAMVLRAEHAQARVGGSQLAEHVTQFSDVIRCCHPQALHARPTV